MNTQVKEIASAIPNNIIAYDGDPNGQHLYTEQKEYIAIQLYNVGYRKDSDTAKKILTYLYEKLIIPLYLIRN